MTVDRVRELKIGIYRIYWTEGGSSIAAVGITRTGDKWIAPLNWVHPSESMEVWEKVEEAVPLRLGWV